MPKFTEIRTIDFLGSLFVLFVIAWLATSCQSNPTYNDETTESLNSWRLGPFVKVDSVNPVLEPEDLTFLCPILNKEVAWEAKDVFNPAAVVKDGNINLLYRAEDFIGTNNGTSRIGLAISEDGLQFTKRPSPIFYPENDSLKPLEWDGGVEDPRIISTDDGRYFMTYTSYDGVTARLMYAISDDLILLDDPSQVIERSENYFLTPEKDYEIDGQINHVCFIEGMVPYKGNWFLYYGTADSKIAVAVCKL